jgi:F-type H+-transporting ATPase subunit alpha
VISIFAGVNGYLDNIPVTAVGRFEAGLLADIKANHPAIVADIRDTKDLSNSTRDALKDAIAAFAKTFA